MLTTLSAETILRAQEGQPEQLGLIYQRYHRSIFRYLYYRVGNQQLAEDLTADVFLRMIHSLRDYRLQGPPFQAWLFRIARNLAVDHFRRTYSHQVVKLSETQPDVVDTELLVERNLTSEQLQHALTQVSEEQRDVIVMRFILGMSLTETAQAIHRSEDAVKGLQRRGLMTLRKIFDRNK